MSVFALLCKRANSSNQTTAHQLVVPLCWLHSAEQNVAGRADRTVDLLLLLLDMLYTNIINGVTGRYGRHTCVYNDLHMRKMSRDWRLSLTSLPRCESAMRVQFLCNM